MYRIANLWDTNAYRPLFTQDGHQGHVLLLGPLYFAEAVSQVMMVPVNMQTHPERAFADPIAIVSYDGHDFEGRVVFAPDRGTDRRPAAQRRNMGLELRSNPMLVEDDLKVPRPISGIIEQLLLSSYEMIKGAIERAQTPVLLLGQAA
jgi:hypothetical protein